MKKDKYEVIMPARIYVVIGLEEVRRVLEKYKGIEGVCVKLKKEKDL